MKKVFRIALLLTVMVMLLCVSAAAADVYDLTTVTTDFYDCKISAQTAGGQNVGFDTMYVNEATDASCVFLGVDKLSLTFTASNAKDDYVVFMLKASETAGNVVPNENNIVYINQEVGKAKQTFTIYPSELTAGEKYNIYVSSKTDSYTLVGSLLVAESVKDAGFQLGDVDNDGDIDTTDAIWILRYYVGLIKDADIKGNEKLAANTDRANTNINTVDAIKILRYYVGLINTFY